MERVLIVSDDPKFAEELLSGWPEAGGAPEVDVRRHSDSGDWPKCCIAVLDGTHDALQWNGEVPLAIFVGDGRSEAMDARRAVLLRREDGWARVAAALVAESVLRSQAVQQLEELRQHQRGMERYSALGKFISKELHSLANALTSVLGHSDLLLCEEDVSEDSRRKVKVIHDMSLRIFEVLQRLSMLDKELQLAERQDAENIAGRAPGSSAPQ